MKGLGALLLAALLLAGCGGEKAEERATPQAAVVVWSDAADFPLAPVLAAWTRASGVPVEIVTEGEEPPARTDLVLTADTERLWRMTRESGLRPVYSDVLEANVPAALGDPDSMWYGVSWNPLVVVYDTRTIGTAAPEAYAALAEDRWRGRLCLATSGLAGNRLLLASLIAEAGETTAERLVRGWVRNLAERPFDAMDELLAAIATERCAVGIADAGAVARVQANDPGGSLEAVAPPTGTGVPAIVTAAGVTRHATNPDGAAGLLEWLSGEPAQTLVAAESKALPVNAAVPARMPVPGAMPAEPFDAALAASRLQAAALLAERAGYR